jgi:hypothetical protein
MRPQRHQPVHVIDGSCGRQHGGHKREHGGSRANADGERDDGGERRRGRAFELSNGGDQIEPQMSSRDANYLA